VDFTQSEEADLFFILRRLKKEKDADLNPMICGIFP
jgi:hypothetical protein